MNAFAEHIGVEPHPERWAYYVPGACKRGRATTLIVQLERNLGIYRSARTTVAHVDGERRWLVEFDPDKPPLAPPERRHRRMLRRHARARAKKEQTRA